MSVAVTKQYTRCHGFVSRTVETGLRRRKSTLSPREGRKWEKLY